MNFLNEARSRLLSVYGVNEGHAQVQKSGQRFDSRVALPLIIFATQELCTCHGQYSHLIARQNDGFAHKLLQRQI